MFDEQREAQQKTTNNNDNKNKNENLIDRALIRHSNPTSCIADNEAGDTSLNGQERKNCIGCEGCAKMDLDDDDDDDYEDVGSANVV